jgi:hypothetical protein
LTGQLARVCSVDIFLERSKGLHLAACWWSTIVIWELHRDTADIRASDQRGRATPALPQSAIDTVIDLLSRPARRHGPTAVLRALSRAERAPATIAAF